MKRFLISVAACVLALPAVRSAEPAGAFRSLTFDAALQEARQGQKVLLIDFFTTWCGPCKLLDRTTWADPGVEQLLGQKAVAIRLDAEKEADLAQKYSIRAYPTILILKPDGTEIDRLVGYRPAAEFTAAFTADLAGHLDQARAREQAENAAAESDRQLQDRLTQADALAKSGQNAEALKEYLWLYDVGLKGNRGYVAMRNFRLLASIRELSLQYPAATDEVLQRYAVAKAALLANSGDQLAAADVASINRTWQRERETLSLFDQMPVGAVGRAELGRALFNLFLQKHRYLDAAAASPAEQYLVVMDQEISWAKRNTASPNFADSFKKVLVNGALDEIEALAGAGKAADARKIAERLRGYDDSSSTAEAISARIKKATIPT